MNNFRIDFLNSPLYLLLLIPALFFTLFPYFRLSKKYRKTRNRITSMVLHMLIMVFSVCVLSGMVFRYEKPNDKNEIILLVDVSQTGDSAKEQRDQLIENILLDCEGGGFKVGVVTFGYDQEYAVELTTDISSVYKHYLNAEKPDVSATNIADALEYAKDLFRYPETAKIVLITDGKETDNEAASVIRSIAVQGIKVDTAYVPSAYEGQDVQITGIKFPDYHVNAEEECTIEVTLKSNVPLKNVKVVLEDTSLIEGGKNGESSEQVADIDGEKILFFPHTFLSADLHEVKIKVLDVGEETITQNNEYSSYMYLQTFKDVLIIERVDNDSLTLMQKLNEGKAEDEKYNFTQMNYQSEELPLTVEGFRQYEQVILNNISNLELKSIANPKDKTQTLDVILEEYVREYGGGLFAVGGKNEKGESNVYNQEYMYGSLYEQMLPVQSINYTPPVGIMLIIDVSGSMLSGDKGERPLDQALVGALACVDHGVLSERDYVGLMTLDTDYGKIMSLTPMTQREAIKKKIQELVEVKGGGTLFSQAIKSAAQELNIQKNLARRHIVVVTDGGIAGNDWDATKEAIDLYHKTNGISVSVIGIGMKKSAQNPTSEEDLSGPYDQMYWLTKVLGGGEVYVVERGNTSALALAMREDFRAQPVLAINDDEPFAPVIAMPTSPLVQGIQKGEATDKNRMTVQLDGYFGVKIKPNADLILTAEHGAPIYAQWKYGKGMVGSFMCDLKGDWSTSFMADPNGIKFIDKVVKNLMPLEALTPSEIRMELTEDNYTNNLRVYSTLQKGEYISGELIKMNAEGTEELYSVSLNKVTAGSKADLRDLPCYVTAPLTSGNNYSRADFVVRHSGVYKIVTTKYNDKDEVISKTVETHKSFAYSEEYQDSGMTDEELKFALEELAADGNGSFIQDLQDPVEIFDKFITAIPKSVDPRFVFIILAIVCFLLDIAVRKFKFKWPHEIIRAYKAKRASKEDK